MTLVVKRIEKLGGRRGKLSFNSKSKEKLGILESAIFLNTIFKIYLSTHKLSQP